MPPIIKFTIRDDRSAEVSKRAHRRVMVDVHRDVGELWHREMLPDHFKPSSRHTYRHKPRAKKYLNAKRLAAGGQGPLRNRGAVELGGEVDNVLTGLMMKSLRGHRTVRAFPTRVTVRMFGPRYITMRPYLSNQPDKAAELTRLTEGQRKRIWQRMGRRYASGINREVKQTTKRIG